MDKQVQENITALFGGKSKQNNLVATMKPTRPKAKPAKAPSYPSLLRTLVTMLEDARRASARTVNVIMTTTYWQVGRHIVEFEQAGERRAGYGQQLLDKLSADVNQRFGRGFSTDNLETMRLF